MKNLMLSVLILFGLQAFAVGKTIVAKVTGMHCKSCSDSLTKAIGAMPEVAKCNVSLKEKQATIDLKEGKTLDKVALGKVIEEAGFTLGEMKEKTAEPAKDKKEEPKGDKKS